MGAGAAHAGEGRLWAGGGSRQPPGRAPVRGEENPDALRRTRRLLEAHAGGVNPGQAAASPCSEVLPGGHLIFTAGPQQRALQGNDGICVALVNMLNLLSDR